MGIEGELFTSYRISNQNYITTMTNGKLHFHPNCMLIVFSTCMPYLYNYIADACIYIMNSLQLLKAGTIFETFCKCTCSSIRNLIFMDSAGKCMVYTQTLDINHLTNWKYIDDPPYLQWGMACSHHTTKALLLATTKTKWQLVCVCVHVPAA